MPVRRAVGPIEVGTPRIGDSFELPLVARAAMPLVVRWDGDVANVLAVVAGESGMSPAEMCSRRRTMAHAAARRLAIHVWVLLRRPVAEIASALGITPAAASQLQRGSVDAELAGRLAQLVRYSAEAGAITS